MSPAKIKLFNKAVPPIGHGRVANAPDYCDCTISLHAKKTEKGEKGPFIERDNGEFFSDCSRRILNILCEVNKRPLMPEEEWQNLRERLLEAQNVRKQGSSRANIKKWMEVFPGIIYKYDKNQFINLRLEVLKFNKEALAKAEADGDDLLDLTSEQGEKAREETFLYAEKVDDLFFRYNELAYRHVKNTAGEYAYDKMNKELSNYLARASEYIK
jgi:hypothetical protein